MTKDNTINLLLNDCELTIMVIGTVLDKTDLPENIRAMLNTRIHNCRQAISQANANQLLGELKVSLAKITITNQENSYGDEKD